MSILLVFLVYQPTFQVLQTYNISIFLIKSTNISNLFMITTQALKLILSSTLNLAILAPRYSLKPKPLAKY